MALAPTHSPASRRVASLALIPAWDLRLLSACDVVVFGGGPLADETARALILLGIGQVSFVDPLREEFDAFDQRRWRNFLHDFAPEAVVRHAPRGLECFVQGRAVPLGTDLVIHCLDDGRTRQVVRRACDRSRVPWIDVRLDVFHGSLATHLPRSGSPGPLPGELPGAEVQMPLNPAMAAVMGGLAAQEAAKILLSAKGFPTLAGRMCLVDGQHYQMTTLDGENGSANESTNP